MRVQRLLSFRLGLSHARSQRQNGFHLGNSGTSLIEVLIAAVIASISITAGMQLLIDQNETHMIQSGITEMQHSGRVTMDELVDKVRQAGYQLPVGLPALYAWNTDPDTIAVAFLAEPRCSASTSAAMPFPAAELKCEGSDLSCFTEDTWAYIYDPFVDGPPVCLS